MANYSLATGEIGVYQKTLAANTVDTVTFVDDVSRIEVGTYDGAAPIYFTIDGSTPTVGGAKTFVIPASASAVRELNERQTGQEVLAVKLISAGTPSYWVARA